MNTPIEYQNKKALGIITGTDEPKLRFAELFQGSDMFYLADPTDLTFKKNGGSRWGVKKEFRMALAVAIEGHLDGTLKKGVVLPPIRKSDNKCSWAAIDVDGNIYKDDNFKRQILNKIKKLDLPLVACFSKSRGLHLYIKFNDWTKAETVINILHTFLHKLNLPPETECFPKQSKVTDTGNGIMLPYMKGIGNDWIKTYNDKEFITGTKEEFKQYLYSKRINAEDIKIELPAAAKANGEIKDDGLSDGPSKFTILKKIKNGTIKAHKSKDGKAMGGKYHMWIQIVIAKCVKEGYGDNEILKLIKEVHKDGRGLGYTWPESYQKQINYTRGPTRFNKPNPGDTKILEGRSAIEGEELEKIFKDYCYVMANDMFNKLGTSEFYQSQQLNNFHKHLIKKGSLTDLLLKNANFTRAISFVTSAKYKPGLINITKPGMIPLINKGVVLNIYIPNYLTEKEGDVKFLIDFFIWLIGLEKWKIIEQWIAYHLQYPGEKIKWSVVLVSVIEGTGKGLLARIISRILGMDNVNENANYKHLTNTHNTLLVGTQVLVLNEVSLGDFKSKNEGTNTLKNFVADDYYSCNFKNKPMVKLANLTNILLFSNDITVLGVSNGARRYFFCNITRTEQEIIKKTDEGFFKKAWDFADSDEGASALIYYFNKVVKITKPEMFKARAPITEDLKELIEQSKHPLQKKLEYDLARPDDGNRKIFTGKFCGLITFDELNEALSTYDKDETKQFKWGTYGDDAIYKFLSANSSRWNNGDTTRQISIEGFKHRFHLLDDTRCPIPNKSYKDLTPKQIETIYLNYEKISSAIRNEEKEYNEAKDNLLPNISFLKTWIAEEIEQSLPHTKLANNLYGKFKGKTVEEVYEAIINGDWKIIEKTPLDYLNTIKKLEKIIDKGIRTPEQIVEDNKIKEQRKAEEKENESVFKQREVEEDYRGGKDH